MTRETLTREQLYERLWNDPATKVAAALGISSVALGKIARQLDVPTPGRGYWARRAAGQKPERVLLPARRSGVPESYAFVVTPPVPEQRPENADLHAALEREKSATVEIPCDGVELHPLLRRQKRSARGGTPDAHGAIRIETDGLRARATFVMHIILTELDRRGLHYTLHTASIGVEVGGESLSFDLSEWIRRVYVDGGPSPRERLAAGDIPALLAPRKNLGDGKLRLMLFGGRQHETRTWRDDASGPLERKLGSFFRALYATALDRRVRRRDDAQRDRERAAEREAERVADALREHQDMLELDARRRVDELAYADALRQLAARVAARSLSDATEWCAWATQLADRVEEGALDELPAVQWEDSVPEDASDC